MTRISITANVAASEVLVSKGTNQYILGSTKSLAGVNILAKLHGDDQSSLPRHVARGKAVAVQVLIDH